MGNKRIPIEANKIYHIFNHGIAEENIFRSNDNFVYFLHKYDQHISPVADTFAYCLMPNHFHILVRMKNEEELAKYYFEFYPTGFQNPSGRIQNLSGIITKLNSQVFGNLFNAYTKAINKIYNRKGKLYQEEFDRRWISDDDYFRKIVHYIHFNPVHHGFVDDLFSWKYSSYKSFFSTSSSNLKRKEAIEWFGNMENFVAYHQKGIDEKLILDLESF